MIVSKKKVYGKECALIDCTSLSIRKNNNNVEKRQKLKRNPLTYWI